MARIREDFQDIVSRIPRKTRPVERIIAPQLHEHLPDDRLEPAPSHALHLTLQRMTCISHDPCFTKKKTENPRHSAACPPRPQSRYGLNFKLRDKAIDFSIHSFRYHNHSNFKPHTEKKASEKKHMWKILCPSFLWHKKRKEGRRQTKK